MGGGGGGFVAALPCNGIVSEERPKCTKLPGAAMPLRPRRLMSRTTREATLHVIKIKKIKSSSIFCYYISQKEYPPCC